MKNEQITFAYIDDLGKINYVFDRYDSLLEASFKRLESETELRKEYGLDKIDFSYSVEEKLESWPDAIDYFKKYQVDVVILDLYDQGGEKLGLEVYRQIRKSDQNRQHETEVILVSTKLNEMEHIKFTKRNKINHFFPTRFLSHSSIDESGNLIENDEAVNTFIEILLSAFSNILMSRDRSKKTPCKISNIISESQRMQEVVEAIHRVSPSKATVLLRGESGTGKELIANAIHYMSPRAKAAFIRFNCASIPEGLLESELFGHEKGAFTGAMTMRKGRFELADRGTIFLDEIGDLPVILQPKILRVLQEREFERVGGETTIKVDVRIITATSRNLEERVSQGLFREDLYYRINVIPLLLPPLRDRREDVPVLINFFLKKFNEEHRRSVTLDKSALQILLNSSWPGNVRELENNIERLVIMSRSDQIRVEDLGEPSNNRKTKSNKQTSIMVGHCEDSHSANKHVNLPKWFGKVGDERLSRKLASFLSIETPNICERFNSKKHFNLIKECINSDCSIKAYEGIEFEDLWDLYVYLQDETNNKYGEIISNIQSSKIANLLNIPKKLPNGKTPKDYSSKVYTAIMILTLIDNYDVVMDEKTFKNYIASIAGRFGHAEDRNSILNPIRRTIEFQHSNYQTCEINHNEDQILARYVKHTIEMLLHDTFDIMLSKIEGK